MEINKLATSLSTIPNQSKLYYTSIPASNSLHQIHLPFKETLPLKFPKRYIRKRTEGHMLQQTIQNPQKSCIRNYPKANHSRIFEEPEPRRRAANPGLFHSLSRESLTYQPRNRSVEDIGIPNNRKKVNNFIHSKPDPITIGQRNTQHNSALQRVWVEPRRHRDNGKFCQQSLNWNTKKNDKSYLQIYKNNTSKKAKTSNGFQKFSIIS